MVELEVQDLFRYRGLLVAVVAVEDQTRQEMAAQVAREVLHLAAVEVGQLKTATLEQVVLAEMDSW
jgi:hypothetical protein